MRSNLDLRAVRSTRAGYS